ncbi:hypothetical protein, variant [Aphanomyces astaci]|nr:hypothetical protein, variant [Aphanomyces astaci]ETV72226.1 hypothetical protein, variant [Aphanomyces astaci]|eukprot:XP_009838293.1 hypothetical protein, variant [Aphanomyces astaci]
MLTELCLAKTFSSWNRHVLASFLTKLAPYPRSRKQHTYLPYLTTLSLTNNMFNADDVVGLVTALRYHDTLRHLSLAYSLPHMTAKTGQWISAGLLHSPYSNLQSLNLSGLSIHQDAAHAMIGCHDLSDVAPPPPNIAHGVPHSPVPRGLYAIPATILLQHHGNWQISSHSSSTYNVEVVCSTALDVAVVVPGGGIVWLDRYKFPMQQLCPDVKQQAHKDKHMRELVLDDLTSANVVVPLLTSFPNVRSLQRLRLRRYGLTTDELREVLRCCPLLVALDLQACQLSDVSPLIEAWRSPPYPSVLQRLNVAKNVLGLVGATAIFQSLAECPHLQVLDISHNCIGSSALDTLHDALQDNHTLQTITIDATPEGDALSKDHHGTPLHVLPLSVEVQQACFHALYRKLEHQHMLDPSVVRSIFQFAAPTVYRRVRQVP